MNLESIFANMNREGIYQFSIEMMDDGATSCRVNICGDVEERSRLGDWEPETVGATILDRIELPAEKKLPSEGSIDVPAESPRFRVGICRIPIEGGVVLVGKFFEV